MIDWWFLLIVAAPGLVLSLRLHSLLQAARRFGFIVGWRARQMTDSAKIPPPDRQTIDNYIKVIG